MSSLPSNQRSERTSWVQWHRNRRAWRHVERNFFGSPSHHCELTWRAPGPLVNRRDAGWATGQSPHDSSEVDAVAYGKATALHIASQFGFDQICGVLIGAGARLDTKAATGATPLMAAQSGQLTNAALLALLYGDISVQPPGLVCDRCGKTAEEASVKSLKGCANCYAARYCGKECQLAAWPGHKAACKARVKAREEMTRVRRTRRRQMGDIN